MSVRFRYRAATADGQVVEGLVHAPSRQSVLEELRRQRLYPVTVDESTPAAAARVERRLGRRAAVTLWTRNAATLLGAGVPLDRALAFTAQYASHTGLAETVRQVRRAVQGGSSLADALARHPRYFDPLFVTMVSAGEASGALDVVFARLSEHLEESAELRSQVLSALLYPALMAVVATIGVIVLLGFVIPRFAAILSDVGGTLPLSTRLLLGASALLTKVWWLWLLLGATAAYLIPSALARPETRRRWHAARLAWPWIGDIELKYSTARFARTPATNLVVQESVDRAAAALTEGSALAPSLAGTLPPLALQMIAVGEESGRLEELCLRVADTYDGEVRRALRTGVALLEPALILAFGALVGFVALAMLQAIYGINLTTF